MKNCPKQGIPSFDPIETTPLNSIFRIQVLPDKADND